MTDQQQRLWGESLGAPPLTFGAPPITSGGAGPMLPGRPQIDLAPAPASVSPAEWARIARLVSHMTVGSLHPDTGGPRGTAFGRFFERYLFPLAEFLIWRKIGQVIFFPSAPLYDDPWMASQIESVTAWTGPSDYWSNPYWMWGYGPGMEISQRAIPWHLQPPWVKWVVTPGQGLGLW